MGANFSRVKTWVSTEDVVYSDLNAEFDNILTYFTPSGMDDYSANVSQMQTQTDPGEVGSESLATTLAGELARIRFALKEITGESYWYTSPTASLLGISNALGTAIDDNRLVSGAVRVGSQQPLFLLPNGAARTVTVDGTPTNFIYYVNGTAYTISSDTSLTGLTAAPSSNNTCLINDSIAADQSWTKYMGENGTEIPVDTMGSEISALVGKYAAFKIAGTTDEYFIAYVASTTSLTKARRGYFFDSSSNPVPRAGYTNNDVITLMKLSWIYAKTDLTLDVSYTNPIFGKDEPTSPASGDYWFDTVNQTWKKYSGTSYSSAGATLIGVCIQDATNTVAARSHEFALNYTDDNTFEIFTESNSQVKTRSPGLANIWGSVVKIPNNLITWDMTLDLDSGVTEGASTYYYFYMTEQGDKIISDIRPFDRRADLGGYYHPHQSWRCLGYAYNNASSNLTAVNSFYKNFAVTDILPSQTLTTRLEHDSRFVPIDTSGGAFTVYLPPASLTRGSIITLEKVTDDYSACTISTVNSENIIKGSVSAATTSINTIGEVLRLFSDGTSYVVLSRFIPDQWRSVTVTGTWVSNTTYSAFMKRMGDTALYRVRVAVTGAPTAAGLKITLNNSLTIDTAKLDGTQGTTAVGHGVIDDASAGNFVATVCYDSSTQVNVQWHNVATIVTLTSVDNSGPMTWANGDFASLLFQVPISGWEG